MSWDETPRGLLMTSDVGGSKHVGDDPRHGNVAERRPEIHVLDGVCANGSQRREQQEQFAEAERFSDVVRDVNVAVECQLGVVLQATDGRDVRKRRRRRRRRRCRCMSPVTAAYWYTFITFISPSIGH